MKTHHFKAMALAALAMLLAGTAQVQAQSLRDRGGAYIGKIESDGTVRDRGGAYMGKIDSDGSIRDRGGAYRGKVDSDGSIRDRGGAYRGKAENVKRRHAAVFFFFDFF